MPKYRELKDVNVYFYHGHYILMYADSGFHILPNGWYIGAYGTEEQKLNYAMEKADEFYSVQGRKNRIEEYHKRIATRIQEIEKTKKLIEQEEKELAEELERVKVE